MMAEGGLTSRSLRFALLCGVHSFPLFEFRLGEYYHSARRLIKAQAQEANVKITDERYQQLNKGGAIANTPTVVTEFKSVRAAIANEICL
jgi:hypothetical protein